ncbi:MAG: YncE family protein, partial [Actinomycetota bacterium]|nr:YncE family protein [Actinomycetota bacterium]
MRQKRVVVSGFVVLVALVATAASARPGPSVGSRRRGRVGPAYSLTANGRLLRPAGRMTQVGDFPTGGALSRNGRFYWAVDSGHGKDDVQVVNVATGAVVQTLPLPGAYGGIAFSPDGRTAYVAGEPRGSSTPSGPTVADGGDAIHVFAVDGRTGRGTEQMPLQLPPTTGGTAQSQEAARLGWPIGMAVSADGQRLLVALNQADALAVVDLVAPSHPVRLVHVGAFPYDVATGADTRLAYVSNELDGTVSVVDLELGTVVASVGVGGPRGDHEAHPEGLLVDPYRHLLYVAVTSRDTVVAINTVTRRVVRSVSVARRGTLGTAPLDLAESPDGTTLYAADSGEDAVAAIALTARPHHRGDRRIRRFDVIGRLPTAAYTSAVAVTPDGGKLVWLAAKGLGAGPNPQYGSPFANSGAAPYGSYVPDKLLGYVGVLRRPTDRQMRLLTLRADRQLKPANARPAPRRTPVQGPDGGPSTQIKHVFYIVRENRTYDQILGSEPRGDGDPSLEVADDNGRPGPAGGITPNAHALARRFPLLDHFYADSEVSTDGHVITSGSYAIDFVQKALHADYSGRGHVNNAGQAAETNPPNAYVFDQAVRQNVSFRNFGEFSAGLLNDGRPTYPAVTASQDFGYPFHFGCDGTYPTLNCSTDSGHPGLVSTPATSRFDYFHEKFDQWVAGGVDTA